MDKGDSLFADTVFYNEASKVGRATGNMRLSDGEVIAYAPSGEYFIDEKRIRFGAGVRLIDDEATITGEAGTYWTEEKRAEIDNNVRLRNARTYMEADSLTYHREEEKALARGNVFIERLGLDQDEVDSTRRTVLFSQWAYSEEPAGHALMRGRPLLIQLRQDSARQVEAGISFFPTIIQRHACGEPPNLVGCQVFVRYQTVSSHSLICCGNMHEAPRVHLPVLLAPFQ